MTTVFKPVQVKRTEKGHNLASVPVWISEWERQKRLVFSLTDRPRTVKDIHGLILHVSESRIRGFLVELIEEGYIEATYE